ncbi:type II toxin-antitoxin system RelE/ParE family toxin [Limnohabitans sp. Rim8]
MAWTIEYADTAKGQLRKLDKQMRGALLTSWTSALP